MVKLPEGEDENEWLAVNSTPNSKSCEATVGMKAHANLRRQWWTFTIRSTSFTAPSPSSALLNRVQK